MQDIRIEEFYKLIMKDKKLSNKLKIHAAKISTEDNLKVFIKDEIMPIVREKKLDFTEEDLINYEKIFILWILKASF